MKRLASIFSLILFFVVCGCAGIQYQDQPKSSVTLNVERQQAKTKVLAQAEEWRNTGVVVEKGRHYEIRAKGRWTAGGFCGWSAPDGVGTANMLCIPVGLPVKGWSQGALIARIGADGVPFAVGNELSLEPDQNDVLYLRMNDQDGLFGDNDGYVDVEISLKDAEKKTTAQPLPVPASGRASTQAVPGIAGQKWAVVIGVSAYKDTRIAGLRYAAADARMFYDWLISRQGGGYAPSRVRLFLDSEATGQRIKNALFNWLRQALEEDMVTIYFAGHGSPESPDSPGNLFLLPFDANYDDIATTGFPMWDIETALKRYIKARKVVVIADACHSGGIGQSFDIARRGDRGIEVNPINSGLQNLSKIGDGVAVISAADDRQLSQESQSWGGGHGVFTYFLIKGITGDADYSKDGRVTLGELIPYLSEQVRRETKSAQSPTVAGKFDPALSIGP
jgi:uncharacterized caspase-like protein